MRVSLAVALFVTACGGAPKPTPTPPPPPPTASGPVADLSPALAPLAWWLGDWKAENGSEHWVAAAGAIYGVALHDRGGFEVMIVDDAEDAGKADGVLRLFAMPGGTRSVLFTHTTHAAEGVTFGNPAHDDPKTIEYARTPTGLVAKLKSESGTHITFEFTPTPHVAAPELEAADLAFAADTKARGVDGWTAAFAPDGWMWRKTGKVEGAAIGDSMRPLLTSGVLAWAPVASGKLGSIGFTVGKATFTGTKPGDHWQSSYVSIWKQQADGTWKVLFDTGRAVNQL